MPADWTDILDRRTIRSPGRYR